MSLSELCKTHISSSKLKDETERNIIEFAEAPWGLGMGSMPGVPPLFPVQKFIFKTYYNIPLDNGDERKILIRDKFNEKDRFLFNEVEYLNFLYNEGRINIKEVTGDPKKSRSNLVLVIGRRGLKTSSIAVLVSFETYKLLKKTSPHEYYKIMPDDEIRMSCVATNQEQAGELFRRISGHLERSEYFKKYRTKPTLTYMKLCTQRDIEEYGVGKRSSLRIVASPCTGRGLRSHNNIIAILDEMAHFFESDTATDKSDKAIFEAVTPSVAKFTSPGGDLDGRVICISSPKDRSGMFYELYKRSMEENCEDLLMIQAPTWEVDYTLSPKYMRAKYIENPVSYMSEFGGEFSDRVSAWIENEQMLRINIVPGLRLKKMSYERVPHFMGIDVGLKQDGTAIAICHIVKEMVCGVEKGIIELDCLDSRYAKDEDKEYFHPDDIADWIASYMDKFYIVKGMMDQYYGLAMIPKLYEKGIKQIQAVHVSREYSSRVYQNLMSKMLDVSLKIPEDEEHVVDGKKTKDINLIKEMLRLRAVTHSKYLITVKAPDVKDAHDDESDAYARAVFLATEYMASGGGVVRSNQVEGASSRANYRQYYMKQKRNVLYTMRPSSALQMEASRNRHFNSVSSQLGSRR